MVLFVMTALMLAPGCAWGDGPKAVERTPIDSVVGKVTRVWIQSTFYEPGLAYEYPSPVVEAFSRLPLADAWVTSVRAVVYPSYLSRFHEQDPCGKEPVIQKFMSCIPGTPMHNIAMAIMNGAGEYKGGDRSDGPLTRAKLLLALSRGPSNPDPVAELLANAEEFQNRAMLTEDTAHALLEYEVALASCSDFLQCLGAFEQSIYGTVASQDGTVIAEMVRKVEQAGGTKLIASRTHTRTVISKVLDNSPQLRQQVVAALEKERQAESRELRDTRDRLMAMFK